jgi:hypothetical protein|tara:strand:+ start:250 stop:807 length:558 start_codon:yes stop_codon:yes gene_type:complete
MNNTYTKLEKIKDFCFSPKDMQLKAIKHYSSMSEETYCYEANLYILDVKICRVSNRGRGGGDDFDFEELTLSGIGFINWKFVQDLNDWCLKNLPKWYFEYRKEYCPKSLETWCAEQVDDFVNWKEFNKALKKSVLYLDPTKDVLYEFNLKPTSESINKCKEKFPNHTFLNNIAKYEAFKIYMEKT